MDDHNRHLEKISRELGVENYTQIDKEIAKTIRKDFVAFLEEHWAEYIEISKW